ncbi:MAG: hypothetical protein H7Y86_14835 [Rhizobacter sp.]|nr:hypothetical protein [Ferruginibacter sp.]
MQKPARLLFLFLSLTFIISCNSKNTKTVPVKESVVQLVTDTVQIAAAEMINLADYNHFFNKLSTQKFTADHKNVSVITAQKGLKVTIDPAVLEKENGQAVDDKIAVAIIELTDSEDFFKANVATVSNGKLLASGGSYFIGMECGGQKLRIKKGKTLSAEFPVLKAAEMELFYGERDSVQDMNWIRAGIKLEQPAPREKIEFADNDQSSGPDILPGLMTTKEGVALIHPSLKRKVYYVNKLMSLEEMVDSINAHVVKVVIDTVRMWPVFTQQLAKGQHRDTGYLLARYGPEKQYILRTFRDIEKEKERKALAEKKRRQAIENWQPQTLAGQLQKYYDPAGISSLGWINCDRFYRSPLDTEVELDLPITFRSSGIQYFLLYTSINGLMKGTLAPNENGSFVLPGQPAGQQLLLIAFIKKDGKIFQSKESFVINKNKTVKLYFTEISGAAMNKMFGRNVRI